MKANPITPIPLAFFYTISLQYISVFIQISLKVADGGCHHSMRQQILISHCLY